MSEASRDSPKIGRLQLYENVMTKISICASTNTFDRSYTCPCIERDIDAIMLAVNRKWLMSSSVWTGQVQAHFPYSRFRMDSIHSSLHLLGFH